MHSKPRYSRSNADKDDAYIVYAAISVYNFRAPCCNLANFAIQLVVMGIPILLLSALYYWLVERPCMDPDWPSKLWHWATGRSGDEVELLDAGGVSEGQEMLKK